MARTDDDRQLLRDLRDVERKFSRPGFWEQPTAAALVVREHTQLLREATRRELVKRPLGWS